MKNFTCQTPIRSPTATDRPAFPCGRRPHYQPSHLGWQQTTNRHSQIESGWTGDRHVWTEVQHVKTKFRRVVWRSKTCFVRAPIVSSTTQSRRMPASRPLSRQWQGVWKRILLLGRMKISRKPRTISAHPELRRHFVRFFSAVLISISHSPTDVSYVDVQIDHYRCESSICGIVLQSLQQHSFCRWMCRKWKEDINFWESGRILLCAALIAKGNLGNQVDLNYNRTGLAED